MVTEFDEHVGLGVITDGAGTEYPFHCVEIVDGTRTIDDRCGGRFEPMRKLGRVEASGIVPASGS